MAESDAARIVSIMKANCSHAYLATVDRDQPRVRPVSAIVEDDMSIWVLTFGSSRKVKQLQQNSKVCLAFVQQPDGSQAAVVEGDAAIVSDQEQRRRVWKLSPWNPAEYFPAGPDSKEYCLVRICPRRVEWREDWEAGNRVYEPGPSH